MNVKELRLKLAALPDTMQVFVAPRITEFQYGLVNSIRVEEIAMKEEPDGEILAHETVVILDEE